MNPVAAASSSAARPLFSATWLILRNDLRLLWRDVKTGRMGAYANFVLVAALLIVANVVSIAIFVALGRAPSLNLQTVAWLFFGFMMLGAAMNHAIRVLFERADFDLLLASPISPRAILLARLTTMTVGAALASGLFVVPLANGMIAGVSSRYAAIYPVWLLLSCISASAAVWGTLLLVQWLGARRARTWAQVISAVLGAGVYLVVQGQNILRLKFRPGVIDGWHELFRRLRVDYLARAGQAEFGPLLAVALLAALSIAITTKLLHRMFITGVQEAGGIAPKSRKRPRKPYRFRTGVGRATFLKDLRLIARDPLLLAQVLPTAMYYLPVMAGFLKYGSAVILGPLAVLVAGQFSLALTAVAAAGEECWDLIHMSPTPELKLRLAKMAAGMVLPVAIALVLCVIVAFLGRPWLALLAAATAGAASTGCAWLQVTRIRPTPRRDVLRRRSGGDGDISRSIFSAVLMLVCAGGVGMVGAGLPRAGAVALGVGAAMIIGCFVTLSMEEVSLYELSPAKPSA